MPSKTARPMPAAHRIDSSGSPRISIKQNRASGQTSACFQLRYRFHMVMNLLWFSGTAHGFSFMGTGMPNPFRHRPVCSKRAFTAYREEMSAKLLRHLRNIAMHIRCRSERASLRHPALLGIGLESRGGYQPEGHREKASDHSKLELGEVHPGNLATAPVM